MPMLDGQTFLSNAQAITVSAVSTNTIDLVSIRDAGAGDASSIIVTCDVTAAAAGAATLNIQLITSTSPTLSSPTIIGQTDAIPKATFVAAMRPLLIPIPRAFINPLGQRYFGLQYTVGTGPFTALSLSARIAHRDIGTDSMIFYPLNVPSQSGVPTGISIR